MKENSFKQIEPREQLPASHKKGVIETIEVAKLVLDMVDLFTNKRVRSEAEILASAQKRIAHENANKRNSTTHE
jgi:hypothetical protein